MLRRLLTFLIIVVGPVVWIEGSDAQGITGVWSGILRSHAEEIPITYKFTPTGNPVYAYHTARGGHEVELSASGQSIRFVPAEGGVMNVLVQSLSVLPDQVSYVVSISHQRSSRQILDQTSMNILANFLLTDAGLHTTVTIQTHTRLSRPDMMIPGEYQQATYHSMLKKVRSMGFHPCMKFSSTADMASFVRSP